jgi:hypothetical protein
VKEVNKIRCSFCSPEVPIFLGKNHGILSGRLEVLSEIEGEIFSKDRDMSKGDMFDNISYMALSDYL